MSNNSTSSYILVLLVAASSYSCKKTIPQTSNNQRPSNIEEAYSTPAVDFDDLQGIDPELYSYIDGSDILDRLSVAVSPCGDKLSERIKNNPDLLRKIKESPEILTAMQGDAFKDSGKSDFKHKTKIEAILSAHGGKGTFSHVKIASVSSWPPYFDEQAKECYTKAAEGLEFVSEMDFDYKLYLPLCLRAEIVSSKQISQATQPTPQPQEPNE